MMELISGQLYQYLQSVQAYISPPIAAVFLLGLFWRRVNARGAIAALATGFVLGLARLVLELNRDALGDGFLAWYAGINFLHFAVLLFVTCAAVLVLASFTAPPPADERLAGLTLQTRAAGPAPASHPAWRRRDLQLSLLLAAAVAAIWLVFSR
jgi:SSS family solute:Na+ symporter